MTAHTTSRRATALLVALGTALAVPLAATPAGAAPGTISGTVAWSGGTPTLSDLKVRFIGNQDSRPTPVGVAPNGAWSIPWTSNECGWVEAYSSSGYWSTERPSQQYCSGDTVPTLTMVPAGAVTGTVTVGANASPATSVVALTSTYQVAYRGPVNDNGTYRLGGLRPGSYRIAFDHSNPNYEGVDTTWSTVNQVRYWRTGYNTGVPETQWNTATLLPVTANTDVANVNGQVQKGGAVSGDLTCRNASTPAATNAYGISLPPNGEPFIDRFGHTESSSWEVTGQSEGINYIYLVYGCEMPVFSGNTLNPYWAEYLPGASTEWGGNLDVRTAKLFNDVGAFTAFVADMQWLVMRGIATGYADDTFRPVTPVRRDAMAAFLYRMAGEPAYTPPGVSPFADVTTSTQFYKEMSWLYSRGISTGWVENGRRYYKPGLAVARDAMAAFLYRFEGQPAYTEAFHFDDVDAQTLFHKEMNWMFDAGVSTGYSENGQTLYKPLGSVNRDAMAAFLHRLDTYEQTALAAPASARTPSSLAARDRASATTPRRLDPRVLATLKARG